MNCFSCFQSQKRRKSLSKRDHGAQASAMRPETKKQKPECLSNKLEEASCENIAAQAFTFREIASATKNFREECLLGEGGFGRAFKGTLNKQEVAIKQLDRSGMQGNKEFLVEVLMLSLLNHPNLVNLIGYCADGDQRLLVYEFMTGGSLQDHLFDLPPEKKPLDWFTRMRIALGAANGLEYLHDKANPPVVYGDLKPTNILLDENSNPRLSDFGLVKLSSGDKIHFSSRLMGTYGYSAPEYSRGGQLTLKSDVYSFGVILLELITGRRAIDPTKPVDEQNLVAWAQPIFRDPKGFPDMADPLLERKFPEKDLNQAVAVAAMCLQEEPATRPLMSDVVTALSFLSMAAANATMASPTPPPTPPSVESAKHDNSDSDMSTRSRDGSGSSGHKCSRKMRNRDADVSLNGSNHGNVSSNCTDSSHYHNTCLSKKNSKDGSFSSPEKCNNDNQDLHDNRSRSLSYSGRLLVGSTNSEDNR